MSSVIAGIPTRNASQRRADSARRDSVDALRRQLADPLRFAAAIGIPDARPHGRGCFVQCFLHEGDETPSLSFFVGDNGGLFFRCFGCGARGDVLTLVARTLKLDPKKQFRRILRAARAIANDMDAIAPASRPLEGAPHGTDAGLVDDFTLAAIITTLLVVCPLDSQPDVAAYLANRGILDQAKRDGWGALPPLGHQSNVIAQLVADFGPETVAGAGLVGAGGGFVWPDHRLLTPWRSPSGRPVTLQRRLVRAVCESEPKYVTARGHSTAFPYGVDALTPGASVAIVEGAVDVLSLRELCEQHEDARAVLGVPGVSNWRREWARIATGRVVYIALDADTAGENGVAQIERDVRAAGATRVLRSKPLGGKDWNDTLVGSFS